MSHCYHNQAGNWNQRLFSWKICSLGSSFRHFGIRRVNMACNIRFMDSYVLNKTAKFGAKMFNTFLRNCDFHVGAFYFDTPCTRCSTIGDCTFPVATPRVWTTLQLCIMMSLTTFKQEVKTTVLPNLPWKFRLCLTCCLTFLHLSCTSFCVWLYDALVVFWFNTILIAFGC